MCKIILCETHADIKMILLDVKKISHITKNIVD